MYDSGQLVICDLDQTPKCCADGVLKTVSAKQDVTASYSHSYYQATPKF